MSNIYNVAGLLDGLTQSPSEAVPLNLDLLWESPGASLMDGQSTCHSHRSSPSLCIPRAAVEHHGLVMALWQGRTSQCIPDTFLCSLWCLHPAQANTGVDRQSVAFSEEGVQNSLCLFTGTPCDGVSSSDLVCVSNCFLRVSNLALLAVCGSQSNSSELPLVTSLAFSDLALAYLEGILLTTLEGSGVEVLLICALHWSLFAARAFCWVSKLLVTALPYCSLTVWMVSCMDLWTIATSGRGEYSILVVRLPDSGDDGFEISLLLTSLLNVWHQPEINETLQADWPVDLPVNWFASVMSPPMAMLFQSWSFILLLFNRNCLKIFHFGRMLWCWNHIFHFGRMLRSWKQIIVTWIWWLLGLLRNRCYLPFHLGHLVWI